MPSRQVMEIYFEKSLSVTSELCPITVAYRIPYLVAKVTSLLTVKLNNVSKAFQCFSVRKNRLRIAPQETLT